MIWYPSHGEVKNSQVSVRVLEHLLFMNSKTLFKARTQRSWLLAVRLTPPQFQRKDPVGRNRLPVMVHINYHPDKARLVKHCLLPLLLVYDAVGAHESGGASMGGRRHAGAGQLPRWKREVSGCYSATPRLLLINMNKTRRIVLGLFESIVWRCSNVQRGSFRQVVFPLFARRSVRGFFGLFACSLVAHRATLPFFVV